MNKARRYNSGKPRYSLLPSEIKELIVDVFTKGAHKYTDYKDSEGNIIKGADIPIDQVGEYEIIYSGANNWKKGLPTSNYIDSAQRHIESYRKGEDMDELGTHHLGNAIWNLGCLYYTNLKHPELDDREFWYNKPFKKVFLDLDGVLAAFEEAFEEKYNITIPPHDWADHRYVGRLEELKNDKDFWINIKPLIDPSTIAYPIAGYCTARSIPIEWIQEWLNNNMFPVAPIIRVNFGESKADLLKENGCEIMIDDSIHNFTELNSKGITTYLMSRPHNKKYDVGGKRITDLPTFFNKLK